MNDIWEARRKHLTESLRASALNLFEYMGCQAFLIPLDPPHQILFVVAGDIQSIQSMLLDKSIANRDKRKSIAKLRLVKNGDNDSNSGN